MKLITPASFNTKLAKTEDQTEDFSVWSLSLAPASLSGKNVCPNSSAACRAACVGSACGLVTIWPAIMSTRIRKAQFFQDDPGEFCRQLHQEIANAESYAIRMNRRLVVRLNCFSDIVWESAKYAIPQQHQGVIFYDYTKLYKRVGKQPSNYHLCASWTERERDQAACLDLLDRGHNVAVVFAQAGPYSGNRALGQDIPTRWRLPGSSKTWTVFPGDDSDLRIPDIDPGPTRTGNGRICGLALKSSSNDTRAAAMASGFCQIVD